MAGSKAGNRLVCASSRRVRFDHLLLNSETPSWHQQTTVAHTASEAKTLASTHVTFRVPELYTNFRHPEILWLSS
jgi:hypothetical protein